MERLLAFDGSLNARDLGGFRVCNAGVQVETKMGALIRSAALDNLSNTGWDELRGYGIGTVIDLRNDSERKYIHTKSGIDFLHLPLEDPSNTEFWEVWRDFNGTPLYYKSFLEQFPGELVRTLSAIARAKPGGVLFHCASGRDRTGLVSIMLLALAGVGHDDIVEDYEISTQSLKSLHLVKDQQRIEEALTRGNTSIRQSILAFLSRLDAQKYLRDAGFDASDLSALKARFVGSND